ncbi:chitinase [Nonomuraea longicatena]|uniref:Chitinase n=1 Tax=Nonomuraea longicatena TaxID=83682 RepID=A0ABP3Z356_9ACTN
MPSPQTAAGPSAYVSYVDTARAPSFDLPGHAARSGVRWYVLGHLVSGGDGCAPRWSGRHEPGGDPVANRIGRLRAEGADAGLSFGGPTGTDLADACASTRRLTAAYRRMVGAFDADFVDFEPRDDLSLDVVLRRARAVRALQRERPLHVSLTLPVGAAGLSERDLAVLRFTHEAGAVVSTVNLLAPIEPHSAGEGRMHRVAEAVRAAHRQVGRVFALRDEAAVWRRIAVTSVLTSPADLDEVDARKLSTFAVRNELAWLSMRGATPVTDVCRILWRTRG